MSYALKDRKSLSKTFSSLSEIGKYRELLRNKGSRYAGTCMADKEALARMLYYELLGYYTVEEIEGGSAPSSTVAGPGSVSLHQKTVTTVKKKLTSSLSTLISAGKSWMTRKQDSQTASSPTGSTFTAG